MPSEDILIKNIEHYMKESIYIRTEDSKTRT